MSSNLLALIVVACGLVISTAKVEGATTGLTLEDFLKDFKPIANEGMLAKHLNDMGEGPQFEDLYLNIVNSDGVECNEALSDTSLSIYFGGCNISPTTDHFYRAKLSLAGLDLGAGPVPECSMALMEWHRTIDCSDAEIPPGSSELPPLIPTSALFRSTTAPQGYQINQCTASPLITQANRSAYATCSRAPYPVNKLALKKTDAKLRVEVHNDEDNCKAGGIPDTTEIVVYGFDCKPCVNECDPGFTSYKNIVIDGKIYDDQYSAGDCTGEYTRTEKTRPQDPDGVCVAFNGTLLYGRAEVYTTARILNDDNEMKMWGDCTGAEKFCEPGSMCVKQNDWYSQCLEVKDGYMSPNSHEDYTHMCVKTNNGPWDGYVHERVLNYGCDEHTPCCNAYAVCTDKKCMLPGVGVMLWAAGTGPDSTSSSSASSSTMIMAGVWAGVGVLVLVAAIFTAWMLYARTYTGKQEGDGDGSMDSMAVHTIESSIEIVVDDAVVSV